MTATCRCCTRWRSVRLSEFYEGFGLPVAEAMSCGTPVLVSGDGALDEVVGDAAVVVDALSVESIAEGLSRLLSDGELRQKLSEEGKSRAARFTWEAAAEQVLGVYREVGQSRKLHAGQRDKGRHGR